MKKASFASIALLALVLGLGLFPAIPAVQAAEVCLSKDTVPGSPHEYHIGDTIEYVMTVHNPHDTQSMTVDVWDELPPYADNPNPADIIMLDDDATFAPGETRTYYRSYIVKASDLEQLPVNGAVYNVIVNTLRVRGEQHYGLIDAEVTKPSIVIQPDTLITISSAEQKVFVGDPASLTIKEKNRGDVSLTGVYVELFAGSTLVNSLTRSSATPSGGNTDDFLDPGETWTWTLTTPPLNEDTAFVAVGHGIDPLGLDVTYVNGFTGERDQVVIPVIWPNPDSLVTLTSNQYEVHDGDEVTLTIKEKNTGNVPLTNVYVELLAAGSEIETLGHASAQFSGGNVDAVLEPGETWTWTAKQIINEDTTFVAIGHGLDPTGLDITPANDFESEMDEITVIIIHPNTEVGISCVDDEVLLSVTESNTGDIALKDVYVELFANGTSVSKLSASSATSKGNGDAILDPGETWSWVVTRCIGATTTFVVVGHGLDPTGLDITYDNGFLGERDQVTLRILCLRPDTQVSITSPAAQVIQGQPFNLTISETNTGCVSLTGACVELSAGSNLLQTLTHSSATFSGGNADNILDPGETWEWTVSRTIDNKTAFVAIGHGMDISGFDITYENGFLDERDEVTVDIITLLPDSLVTMTADRYWIYTAQEVELTISEKNTGYFPLTEVRVELFADGAKIETLAHSSAASDGNTDNVLDPGETWTWTVTRTISEDTDFVAVGHGLDPTEVDITCPAFPNERAEITVGLLAPNTEVNITSNKSNICEGESMSLTIREKNTGGDKLSAPYVELFANGSKMATLNYATATPNGGNGDNILDPGETWTWTVALTIAEETTFVAIGHGKDPAGLDITYPMFTHERAEIAILVTPMNPNTVVVITSDEDAVDVGGTVKLAISEENTGNVPLTSVYVDVFAGDKKIATLNCSTGNFSGGNDDSVLDPEETWSWEIARTVTADTTFVAIGHGLDPREIDVTYPSFATERCETKVKVISRGIEVTIDADRDKVCDCESFDLTIGLKNTGNVALMGAYVELFANGSSITTLDASTAGPSGGNSNDVLDPGETWTWTVPQSPSATTTYLALGHGTDPEGVHVTSPDGSEITIEVTHCGEATRTQGFWKTHYDYTAHVFTEHLDMSMDLGWVQLDSVDDVMGMLWADVAKNSTGANRDKLCQARVIASHQAVAAILNSSLDNGALLPMSLSEIASTLGRTDIDAIKALGEALDSYNNSGDKEDIIDSDGYDNMSATPDAGKSVDVSIADCSSVPDNAKDMSPAYYGFAAIAAGLAVLVPIRMIRSRRRGNE